MSNKNDFKPYISADKVLPELTITSIITGLILAVVFGAANAYLGLRVGMTISPPGWESSSRTSVPEQDSPSCPLS